MSDDLTPLPRWKQRRAGMVAWWRKSKNGRQVALKNLRSAGAKALTLAISVVCAILVAYGVWLAYAPLGFAVGGLLGWLLLWSHEQDRQKGRRG